jgi:hypothetical protein
MVNPQTPHLHCPPPLGRWWDPLGAPSSWALRALRGCCALAAPGPPRAAGWRGNMLGPWKIDWRWVGISCYCHDCW